MHGSTTTVNLIPFARPDRPAAPQAAARPEPRGGQPEFQRQLQDAVDRQAEDAAMQAPRGERRPQSAAARPSAERAQAEADSATDRHGAPPAEDESEVAWPDRSGLTGEVSLWPGTQVRPIAALLTGLLPSGVLPTALTHANRPETAGSQPVLVPAGEASPQSMTAVPERTAVSPLPVSGALSTAALAPSSPGGELTPAAAPVTPAPFHLVPGTAFAPSDPHAAPGKVEANMAAAVTPAQSGSRTLDDLALLVRQAAARLDEPAGSPAEGRTYQVAVPEAEPSAGYLPAPPPSLHHSGPHHAAAAVPDPVPTVSVDPRLVMEQVAQAAPRLSVAVAGDRHEVQVRLWPRELGEVNLKLVMDNGVLRADLVVSRPEVKAALESNLADLRQRLEQQGLGVESFQVALSSGDSSREQRGGEFLRQRRRWGGVRTVEGLEQDGPDLGEVAAAALAAYGPRGRRLNGLA